ncbi:hypothetical protein ART_0569 [Arthrobacter sp. PAMC 25486]|uniref:hypothetical protein n=1 Tax=Arthrobacter sp. PAMC 25486 TaxID=1494608 RepID=UPI0005362095|nr:hypothetical protein [Arthrobacter sp. PAMC 25486]AIY00168.1 hypothetical protein ART_0569 [Arthrobacter sp. PAMC 25486]
MPFESVLDWIAIGFLVAVFSYRLITVQTARYQQQQVFMFAQRVGLPIGTERINNSLRRRLFRSSNAALLGGLAGGLVAVGVHTFLRTNGLPFTFMWSIAIPAVFVGVTTFDVALTLRDSLFGRQPDTPRMARLEAVTLADYTSPTRLRAAPVLMALAAGLGVAGVVLGAIGVIDVDSLLRGPALLILVAAAVVFGICTVMARKILQLPQPAADTLELAWDDAIKADVIRKLGLLASVMAWLAVSGIGMGILDGLDATVPTTTGNALGQAISMCGYFAILFTFSYGRSFNWFRQRLWPNFTFQPGNPEPSNSGLGQS